MIGQRRYLPSNPSINQLKHQAKDLLREAQARDERALQRMWEWLPRLKEASFGAVGAEAFSLSDAQLALAREYGFRSWPRLAEFVQGKHPAAAPTLDASTQAFFERLRANDVAAVNRMLAEQPALAHARCPGDNRLLGVVWTRHNSHEPVDAHDPRSCTALHHACVNGYAELTRALLRHGADPDVLGYDNNHGECTPVLLAAWEGDLETLRVMLEGGADPDVAGAFGIEPLATAAEHERMDKVELLLTHGARPRVHVAARLGMAQRLHELLNADKSLAVLPDARRKTPLDHAAECGQWEAAHVLVKHGAEVTPKVAAALGMMDRLRRFLDAEPGFVKAARLLTAAAMTGEVEALRLLLERGADPNEGDPDGARPLHHVAMSPARPRCAESVAPLVAAGAELHLVHRSHTPLARARAMGNSAVEAALVAAGARE